MMQLDATIEIGSLLPDGRRRWSELWQGYQAFYGVTIEGDVSDALWNALVNDDDPFHGFAAYAGEEIAGMAHVVIHASTWHLAPAVYLQDLYVDPARRNLGIGRKLIEAATAFARIRGASRLHWLTHESNDVAQALYGRIARRSGFVQYVRATGTTAT